MRHARDMANQIAIRHGQALGARAAERARSWALRHGTRRCNTARRARIRALPHGMTGPADGRAGLAGGAWGARQGPVGHTTGARGACDTDTGRAAWACCWAVGCALGALSLFLTQFDSVLFLSQFWGKIFRKKNTFLGKKIEKKNQIKLDKIFKK